MRPFLPSPNALRAGCHLIARPPATRRTRCADFLLGAAHYSSNLRFPILINSMERRNADRANAFSMQWNRTTDMTIICSQNIEMWTEKQSFHARRESRAITKCTRSRAAAQKIKTNLELNMLFLLVSGDNARFVFIKIIQIKSWICGHILWVFKARKKCAWFEWISIG